MPAGLLSKILITLVLVVAGFWLTLSVILYIFQERLIYFPSPGLSVIPDTVGLNYESIELTTSDGLKISGWYVPAEEAQGVVLFLHGNAGNISHRLVTLEMLNRLGLSALIIDYRGYGNSEGSPTEQGTYIDAETAWNYLTVKRGHKPDKIIIFGRSLGGAIAAWLAGRVSPAGVILESSFTSIENLAKKYYPLIPVSLLTRIHYPTIDFMPAIKSPVLIIHSREDEMVPFSHAKELYEAAGEQREIQEISGGHNEGFLLTGDEYIQTLDRFVDRVLK